MIAWYLCGLVVVSVRRRFRILLCKTFTTIRLTPSQSRTTTPHPPQVGWVVILLLIINYIFCCLGIILFRDTDPVAFKDIPTAMNTMWRLETLDRS